MPTFRWEDIDHSLVNLKLSESAEDMHRKIKEDEKRIQFENQHNLNDGAVPSLVLRMKQEHADALARQVYETYCDVWQKQGQVKSADFVRAVSSRAIKIGDDPSPRRSDCRRVLKIREADQFSYQNPRCPLACTPARDAKARNPLGEATRG